MLDTCSSHFLGSLAVDPPQPFRLFRFDVSQQLIDHEIHERIERGILSGQRHLSDGGGLLGFGAGLTPVAGVRGFALAELLPDDLRGARFE